MPSYSLDTTRKSLGQRLAPIQKIQKDDTYVYITYIHSVFLKRTLFYRSEKDKALTIYAKYSQNNFTKA
jgi:hypothetical protein